MIRSTTSIALTLVAALGVTCAALAQTSAPAADPGAPPPPQVRTSGGVQYINGGAGEEARSAIDAQRAAFPLRVVFSVGSGAYAVADHVVVANAQGQLLAIDNAGPMLLVKVAPGDYTVEATYGAKTERRKVRVAATGTTVNWRWPDDGKQ